MTAVINQNLNLDHLPDEPVATQGPFGPFARISKMQIREKQEDSTDKIVFNYDRGLDLIEIPVDQVQEACRFLLDSSNAKEAEGKGEMVWLTVPSFKSCFRVQAKIYSVGSLYGIHIDDDASDSPKVCDGWTLKDQKRKRGDDDDASASPKKPKLSSGDESSDESSDEVSKEELTMAEPIPTETCDVSVKVFMDYEDDDPNGNDETGSLYAHIDIVWPKKMIECGFGYFMMKKIEDALGNNCESELADEVNALAANDFVSNLSHVSPCFNNRKDFRLELLSAVYFARKESKKGSFECLDLNSDYGIQIVKEYQWYTCAVLGKIFEKYFNGPTAASRNWVCEHGYASKDWVYEHDPCHASFWEPLIPKYKTTKELSVTFKVKPLRGH